MAAKIGKELLQAAFSSSVYAQLSDGNLLSRFVSGDQTAFETLVNRHTSLVLGVCRRMLPTLQDAEDACQATFLVLARKAKTTRWQTSIANWLFTTARQVAFRANRALARRLRREEDGATSTSISVLDQMSGREVLAALDEELDKLPAIHREPLILCYLQGLTRDEAALRLGVRSSTLKCQLERGRKKLAAALTKRGIDIGAGLIAVAVISSARASSPRMIQSVLATVAGSPSASVASLANGITVKGFAMKTKLLILAVVSITMLGFELAAMQTKAGLPEQVMASSMRPETNADARSDDLKDVQSIVKAKQELIDAATITAYENLRAVYGGIMVTDSGHLWFSPGNEAATKNIPSFNLVSLPDGKLSNLPRVHVPFGLDLFNVQVTDEDLKQLKGLNNLTALILDAPNAQYTDAGLKELKELKSLTMLRIGGTRVTDEGLKELKNLDNLTSLSLLGTHVTDVGLKELKSFKKLTSLALGGVNGEGVTDEGLKEIAELKSLTVLALGVTKVTDTGLRELKELKNLKTLFLNGTNVTDEGLKELKGLKSLTTLYLDKNRGVTDGGLKELKNLTNLESLYLAGTRVENVSELKDLKNLTRLDLSVTGINDSGLKDLKNLTNLSSLRIAGNRDGVTDAGLNELKDLKNLTELSLAGTSVTDDGLHALKDLRNLTILDLTVTKVTGPGLKELKELKNLSHLNMSGPQMTDHGLKDLAELENLTHLKIQRSSVTDEGLKELQKLKKLTSLSLVSTQITDAGLKELKELKNLTALNLESTQITDAGLKELKELKNLTVLVLGNTKVTDAGLKELVEIKNLTRLDPSGTKVTVAGLKEFEKALPRCRTSGEHGGWDDWR